jgi:hypothetical protein
MKKALFVLFGLFCFVALFSCKNPFSPATFTVTYDANGATGGSVPTDSKAYHQDSKVTVLGNTGSLVKTGFAFAGWNTMSDGTGTSYAAKATFAVGTGDVTLYAVWALTHTVTYDANGATSGSVPTDSKAYKQGASVTVLGNIGYLAKAGGYAFTGWNTMADGTGISYAVKATFAMSTGDMTLYTLWIPSHLYFTGSGTSITITGYSAALSGSLTIPEGITGIGDKALYGCTSLTSVIIPSSVTTIGSNAFGNCTSLINISVDPANPNYSSTSGVLFNKTGTSLVQVPGGMTGSYIIPASVTTIDDSAFYGCTNLTGVTIPSSVTTIGEKAFSNCTSLTGVTIPSSVTTIGEKAFSNCTSLTGVTIPSSVTTIGEKAFYNCTSLTGVTIPSSVTTIGEKAFYHCTSLTGISVDPANPNYASVSGVLFNQTGTTLILVPGGMTGTYVIPSGVTSIGSDACAYCTSLTGVTIPDSVTDIGDYAFYRCTSLTSVTVQAAYPPAMSPGSYTFEHCASGLQIHVPTGTVAAYQAAAGWSRYASRIVSP